MVDGKSHALIYTLHRLCDAKIVSMLQEVTAGCSLKLAASGTDNSLAMVTQTQLKLLYLMKKQHKYSDMYD